MPYPWASRIEGFLMKEESTYGTDPTPTAGANGIRVEGRIWTTLATEYAFPNLREDVVSGSLVPPKPAVPRGRIATLDITFELKGAGAAYSSVTPVRPEVDPVLIACGLSRTHDDAGGSEKVTYALADTGHGSGTIYAYAGGKEFQIVGCRGNLVWPFNAGQLGRVRAVISGMVEADAEAALPNITYDSVESPAAVAMSLSIDPGTPWSPDSVEGSLDLGNEIVRLDDANGSDGLEGFFISAINPRFALNARTVAQTTYDPEANIAARTQETIDLTLGSTQYNRVKLDVNEAYIVGEPSKEDDNGFAAWALEYFCRDVAIVFD